MPVIVAAQAKPYKFGGNMTATHDSVPVGRWVERLRRVRLVLVAAAIAFAGLWMLDAIAALPALAGFALVAAAALIASARGDVMPAALARDEPRAPRIGDPLIESVLAGLPDPVDRARPRGRRRRVQCTGVAVAPALARGEPVSLGAARARSARGGPPRPRERQPRSGRVFRARAARPLVRGRCHAVSSAGLRRRSGSVLLAFHDLTPLRRVEEMRADFVANASHELRTPLAALSGFIETLQGSARDDPAARERFLAIMKAQADRMARLIDDLLSLSRIELNAHLRPDTPVDLVADRAPGGRRPADAGARPRRRGQDRSAAAAPLMVPGDRDELIRVFENLVENALKYGAARQARRHRAVARRTARTAAAKRGSRCATTVPASRPSICRG